MIENKKLVYYFINVCFLIIGLNGIINGECDGHQTSGLFFISLAVLISPCFEKLCGLAEIKFLVLKKILLGVVLFLLFVICSIIDNLFASVLIMSSYWGVIVFYAKNKSLKRKKIEEEILRLEREIAEHKRLEQEMREKERAAREKFEQEKREKETIKKFNSLDSFIGYVISKLMEKTNEKLKNIDADLYFNKNGISNIKNIIIDFCNDTKYFNSIYEIDKLFNTSGYFKEKILKLNFKGSYKIRRAMSYSKIIESISDNIPQYLNNLFDEIAIDEDLEFIPDLNLGYSFCIGECEDAFLYMICLLLTGACVAKLVFIKEKIKLLKRDSEFYRIISSIKKEFKDTNIVIEKSKSIYDEFYKRNLGLIDSGSPLYNIAIKIIVRKINDEEELDKNILQITNIENYTSKSFENMMDNWIYKMSKEHRFLKIEPYIIYKILHSISVSDFSLFLEALSKTNEYVSNYNTYVKRHNAMEERKRYLNGDFSKEKIEINILRDFKYVTSGREFELFLEKLFKFLGYTTIHNGKSGDQGADLILRKNNYVYTVQAKYYTGKLSNKPIQEVVGSLKYYNANQGVVVTNSEFTKGAQELAKANQVILIDGEALNDLINSVSNVNTKVDILKQFEK